MFRFLLVGAQGHCERGASGSGPLKLAVLKEQKFLTVTV